MNLVTLFILTILLFFFFPMIEKNKLFVGNLDGRVKWRHLKEFFAQYGEVTYTKVAYNRETKRSRGFGFIVFATDAAAEKALAEANGKIMTGKNKEGEEFVFGDREIRLMYAEAKVDENGNPIVFEKKEEETGE